MIKGGNMMENYTINLSKNELLIVLESLGNMPCKTVFHIVNNINTQIAKQEHPHDEM